MPATRSDFSPPQFNGQPMQLVQVHVFFRHGDRSPNPWVPNCWADPCLWSDRLQEVPPLMAPRQYRLQERPFGHLTRKGAEETRALGQWIRDAYLEELDDLQEPSSFVRVRSTDFLRCHLSAWFVLEGLLGSSEAAASVNVTILDEREENLYHNDHCQRLAKKWREALMKRTPIEVLPDGSVEEGGWSTRFKSIRLQLGKQLNIPLNKQFPWLMAVDVAQCAAAHGDPLPGDLTAEKLAEIRTLVAEDYVSTFKDREICTLSMGRLLSEVVHAMKQPSGTCMYLYAGHDATIVPLSVSLGVPWKDWPAYTSSICIELWRPLGDEHGQRFVRVLYDGREVALPVDLPSIECTWQGQAYDKGSKSLVSLDEFIKLAGWSMLTRAEYEMNCRCADC